MIQFQSFDAFVCTLFENPDEKTRPDQNAIWSRFVSFKIWKDYVKLGRLFLSFFQTDFFSRRRNEQFLGGHSCQVFWRILLAVRRGLHRTTCPFNWMPELRQPFCDQLHLEPLVRCTFGEGEVWRHKVVVHAEYARYRCQIVQPQPRQSQSADALNIYSTIHFARDEEQGENTYKFQWNIIEKIFINSKKKRWVCQWLFKNCCIGSRFHRHSAQNFVR